MRAKKLGDVCTLFHPLLSELRKTTSNVFVQFPLSECLIFFLLFVLCYQYLLPFVVCLDLSTYAVGITATIV